MKMQTEAIGQPPNHAIEPACCEVEVEKEWWRDVNCSAGSWLSHDARYLIKWAAVECRVMNVMNAHHENLIACCPASCEQPGILFLEVTSAIDETKLEVKTVDAQVSICKHRAVLALASDGSFIQPLPIQD